MTPQERSEINQRIGAAKKRRAVAQLKEIESTLEMGFDLETACLEAGLTYAALQRKAYRYGFPELARMAGRCREKRQDTRVWADRVAAGTHSEKYRLGRSA